ncbi:hypothetical protein JFL43_22035 [Viridibacillus sp. YIM B01967]|uniref:Cardiolipin synthase N-terminal domain-containing protein n=1 Tax=Viridibacillus soli TaxID=2798301 RepID=A0ABS1HDA6_9BACL|nr:hypothetical protein [Viridibacillus soli]MBK3497437.1 hypothetical protein [Viridibacillus soli]
MDLNKEIEYQDQPVPQQNESQQLSVGTWLLTILIIAIPIVNLIMLCIWAFGEKNPRSNFSKAYLIWIAISITLVIIFWVVLLAIFGASGLFLDENY